MVKISVTITGHCDKLRPNKLVLKTPLANAGDIKGASSIPWSRRSLGGGHGNPLQYSCLEDSVERSLVGYSLKGHKESDTTEAT